MPSWCVRVLIRQEPERERFECESDSTIWVPTRKVWNTHNYVPTFINDDLTVPKEFQNKAIVPGQDIYLT